MTEIRLHEHDFNIMGDTAELSTNEKGWLIVGDETYIIYEHFKQMEILHRYSGLAMDVSITLTEGHNFITFFSNEIYEKIHAIMMEKQKEEYFKNADKK